MGHYPHFSHFWSGDDRHALQSPLAERSKGGRAHPYFQCISRTPLSRSRVLRSEFGATMKILPNLLHHFEQAPQDTEEERTRMEMAFIL